MGLTSHHTWKYPVPQAGPACITRSRPIPTAVRSTGTPEEIARQSAEDIRELIRYSTPGRDRRRSSPSRFRASAA